MHTRHVPPGAERLCGYRSRRLRPAPVRVLVVAPHPDDDAIGCGGLLTRLAGKAAKIRVLYVTDGSASHVKSKRFPPARLCEVRETEARAALRVLGVRLAPIFLRAPDHRLSELDAAARSRLVEAIVRAIDGGRTQVLLTPWDRDPHPDHIATAALVGAARMRSRRRPAVYCYGVWLPVRGIAFDGPRVDEATVHALSLTVRELACKRGAILEHRSQTGALIDDDPSGFCIDAALLEQWLQPVEYFYRVDSTRSSRSGP